MAAVADEPRPWTVADRPAKRSYSVRFRLLAAMAASALVLVVIGWALSRPEQTLLGAAPAPTRAGAETPTPTTSESARPSATPSITPSLRSTPTPRPTATAVASPTPTPVPTPAPLQLVAGTTRSLESINLAGAYLATNGSYLDLVAISAGSTAGARQSASFAVVAGLADADCVTFRAANGRYLRHRDYRLRLDPFADTDLFRQDATFCVRPGSSAGSVSFESVNYPGWYLHRRGTQLWLDALVDSAAFRSDCSFRVALALA